MSLQDSYNLLETMSKRFKVGDNTKTKTVQEKQKQRTGSIVNNSNLNLDDKQDQLCARTISEIVKLASEVKVNGQRTASIAHKIDEVGLLQSFLSTYQ